MRRLLQIILLKPVLWVASRFASKPDKARIFAALTLLRDSILQGKDKKKGILLQVDPSLDKFIIFSDHHKGAKNWADDFREAEPNYLRALEYYNLAGYTYISLGDAEELWENTLLQVKKHNEASFEAEKPFVQRKAFFKVFGNHDLYWANDPFASWQLKRIYETEVSVYEGVILQLPGPFHLFLTHGHQGDRSSDGNWFSKFFVANIWAPLQAYLRINPNTPAYDEQIKTTHNRIMYEWSAEQKDLWLVTGHTHQPVFASLTHLERLHRDLAMAGKTGDKEKIEMIKQEIIRRQREYKSVNVDFMNMVPTYFNSGCCCFVDGDITGIEIAEGQIRLIKWEKGERKVLEVMGLRSEVGGPSTADFRPPTS